MQIINSEQGGNYLSCQSRTQGSSLEQSKTQGLPQKHRCTKDRVGPISEEGNDPQVRLQAAGTAGPESSSRGPTRSPGARPPRSLHVPGAASRRCHVHPLPAGHRGPTQPGAAAGLRSPAQPGLDGTGRGLPPSPASPARSRPQPGPPGSGVTLSAALAPTPRSRAGGPGTERRHPPPRGAASGRGEGSCVPSAASAGAAAAAPARRPLLPPPRGCAGEQRAPRRRPRGSAPRRGAATAQAGPAGARGAAGPREAAAGPAAGRGGRGAASEQGMPPASFSWEGKQQRLFPQPWTRCSDCFLIASSISGDSFSLFLFSSRWPGPLQTGVAVSGLLSARPYLGTLRES